MTHNWDAIGGRSPLTDITLQQGDGAAARSWPQTGSTCPSSSACATGARSSPMRCAKSNGTGARRIVGIPMAPQFSTLSVQKYMDAATAALPAGVEFSCVRSFHDHPLLDRGVRRESAGRAARGADEDVVFTAHSLPQRVAAAGDPYPNEVAATAKAVADRCGIRSYHTAYQSAGRTPEPWLGPDLSEHDTRTRVSAAFAACWSCRSGSCATTRKFCSTSTCRRPPPRARPASPCGARSR